MFYFPFSISGVYQHDVVYDFRREPLSTSAPPTARYHLNAYNQSLQTRYRQQPAKNLLFHKTGRYLIMGTVVHILCHMCIWIK